MDLDKIKISIIGLGYVGCPLFRLFSKHFECVGLDMNPDTIQRIKDKEFDQGNPAFMDNVYLTTNYADIADCNVHIITVPTPIDHDKNPDISMLKSACSHLAPYIQEGSIVIFESTVAPGTTDEVCIPILEEKSGKKVNIDFGVGYSPERVNVGDENHSTSNTNKIISASSEQTLDVIFRLYSSVIDAPLVKASSIKVAEAAKMYENVQRDVLIALSNEYSKYCHAEGIDIHEVTSCASTKWNFAKAYPGLVGGHCIGVDPYYVIDRAKSKNVQLSLINSARDINENTVVHVAKRFVNCVKKEIGETQTRTLLVLGFSYKKNIGDIRNTKIEKFLQLVSKEFADVDCIDPLVDNNLIEHEYNMLIFTSYQQLKPHYDVCIKMLNHSCFDTFEHNIGHFYSLQQFL